jgi:3-phytase
MRDRTENTLTTLRVTLGTLLAGMALAITAAAKGPAAAAVVRPEARGQTNAVPHAGDAADDPAVWVHPDAPAKSLVLGTDKQGGLHVYDLDGHDLQSVGNGDRPNNVDVLYGFPLNGRPTDLAVASTRSPARRGVTVWAIDPITRSLTDATAGPVLTVLPGGDPYGLCTYRSAKTGRFYFFVSDTAGRVEQYRLTDAGRGKVGAEKVRSLAFRSVVEGCVADDELGAAYFAEERAGVWKFGAEPEAGDKGALIARVGEHGLTADVEGLALYAAAGGKGYLIASSQGSNDFKVYARDGDNRFLFTIDPKGGKIDDVSQTDGLAVTSRPCGPKYPKGLLVIQDDHTPGGRQNFKLYAWEDVAGRQ